MVWQRAAIKFFFDSHAGIFLHGAALFLGRFFCANFSRKPISPAGLHLCCAMTTRSLLVKTIKGEAFRIDVAEECLVREATAVYYKQQQRSHLERTDAA